MGEPGESGGMEHRQRKPTDHRAPGCAATQWLPGLNHAKVPPAPWTYRLPTMTLEERRTHFFLASRTARVNSTRKRSGP